MSQRAIKWKRIRKDWKGYGGSCSLDKLSSGYFPFLGMIHDSS